MWLELLWGAAGIFLGCVTVLIVVVIRMLVSVAVVTWNTSLDDLLEREPESDPAARS